MKENDLELRALRSPERVCPYCKDLLGQQEIVSCFVCRTHLHKECYEENGGCTTFGCRTRALGWPRCPSCDIELSRQSSVVCLSCGRDLEGRGFYQTDSPLPQAQWVLPRWMALTERGRGLTQEPQAPKNRKLALYRALAVLTLTLGPLLALQHTENKTLAAGILVSFPLFALVAFVIAFTGRR